MHTRFVIVAAAVLACSAAELRAQEGSLAAFGSDREVAAVLRSLRPPPPPPARPPRPVQPQPQLPEPPRPVQSRTRLPNPFPSPTDEIIHPLPSGSYEGPMERWPAVVAGRVADLQGQPQAGVLVRIESHNVDAVTGADGRYRIAVSAGRFTPGQRVTVTAVRAGMHPVSRAVTLRSGMQVTRGFWMSVFLPGCSEDVITYLRTSTESVIDSRDRVVDEGGIVRAHGRHLFVVYRDRIFTVDVGGRRLQTVDAVNAFAPGGQPADFYELLISGRNLLAIGYHGTRMEANLFRADGRGRLSYRSTHDLRGDSYDALAHTSLLADGRLLLYTAAAVGHADSVGSWMPAMRRRGPGPEDTAFHRTLRPTRIYRPGREVRKDDQLVLHTVTTCGMERGELDCASSAVLAPAGEFHVSPTAVYVWPGEWMVEAGGRRGSSLVYRLPLDGSPATALGVEGSPVDRFSFLESGDGFLNVLLVQAGIQEGRTWARTWEMDDLRLLRVSLGEFADGRSYASRRAYRVLPRAGTMHRPLNNRFVGRHLLYGDGSGWWGADPSASTLYVVRWRGGRPHALPLPHGVDRIEPMGAAVLIVGADTANLHLTGVRPAGGPRVVQRFVHPFAEGESRGHGIYYRQDGPGEGILSLPVAGPARECKAHLFQPAAAVLFLRDQDQQFRPLGKLLAQSGDGARGRAAGETVEWYAGAQAVFSHGRVFALLDDQIVEGVVEDGRIREVARASFAPPPQDGGSR